MCSVFWPFQEDENLRQAFLNIYGVRVDSTASFSWTSIAGTSTLCVHLYWRFKEKCNSWKQYV